MKTSQQSVNVRWVTFCEANSGSKNRWFTARGRREVDDISEEVE